MKRILSTLFVLPLAFALAALAHTPSASCCQHRTTCCHQAKACDQAKCCDRAKSAATGQCCDQGRSAGAAACCRKGAKASCCDGNACAKPAPPTRG